MKNVQVIVVVFVPSQLFSSKMGMNHDMFFNSGNQKALQLKPVKLWLLNVHFFC